MGRSFAHLVANHPVAELAGIADLNEQVARDAAAPFGTQSFSSVHEMLDGADLDGLIVATIEDAHREPCVTALERGIGVLVEKPLASTIESGQAIIEAAERSGASLLVGHVLRFDARYAQMREAVRSGRIGETISLYARRLNGKLAQNRLQGRSSLPLFLGVHDYDMARWVAGSEVSHVFAQSRFGYLRSLGYDIEDVNWALLTFENGVMAAVEEGWVLPTGHPSSVDQKFDVSGTTGRIELTGESSGLTIMNDERIAWPDTALWPTVHGRLTGALEREVGHFVRCLSKQEAPMTTGEDGLAAVRIALAVEESARTGQIVRI
jgi:predicted dehydrogenase